MIEKKNVKISFIILCFIIFLILFNSKFFEKEDTSQIKNQELEKELYSSNKIKGVKYTTKDYDVNEQIITATEGKIDCSDTNIIYLTNMKAIIQLIDSENITITPHNSK